MDNSPLLGPLLGGKLPSSTSIHPMISYILPVSGSVNLEQIEQAIRNAESLGLSASASLRSVRYRSGELWLNIGTLLQVGEREPYPQDLVVGGLRLLARTVELDEISGLERLERTLCCWPGVDVEIEEGSFHQQFSVHRSYSDQETHASPGWSLELTINRPTHRTTSAPNGPFLHPESGFFANDRSNALEQWFSGLSEDRWRNTGDGFRIVIPDRRAQLLNLKVERKIASVEVSAFDARELYCCGAIQGFSGSSSEIVEKVTANPMTFLSEESIRGLALYLMDAGSYCYDHVYYPVFKLQSRLGAIHVAQRLEPSLEQLLEDTNAGEGPQVEFKHWMPPRGDKDKWRELLDTVVGFANAGGGRLYIGVNDRGDIVGVDVPLRKEYGSKHGDNVDAQRDDYAWDIKQAISKGVQPSIEPTVMWVEPAGRWVLCVAVEPGRGLHYVVETNEMFIRKGATTRRAHPHDIERIIESRKGSWRPF